MREGSAVGPPAVASAAELLAETFDDLPPAVAARVGAHSAEMLALFAEIAIPAGGFAPVELMAPADIEAAARLLALTITMAFLMKTYGPKNGPHAEPQRQVEADLLELAHGLHTLLGATGEAVLGRTEGAQG